MDMSLGMDRLSAIDGLSAVSRYDSTTNKNRRSSGDTAFDSILASAMNLVNETDQLSNAAEEEEIRFAMGESDSMHDLMVAQQKANVSLQYTVAVKNTLVEAYKTLLNLQF